MNEPQTVAEIFANTKTIAVVGLSNKAWRASSNVSSYMQQNGYRIIPVNPSIQEALGEKSYPTLDAVREAGISFELINVFRASEFVADIVADAIRLKIPYLWLQDGVIDNEAVERAEAAGIKCVQDDCIFRRHASR